ncbi:MAG: hypothetical protein AAGF85_21565, partial [Bacteroidota bacterium]
DEAMAQLKEFSELRNIQFWFLLMDRDPFLEPLRSHPDFESIMNKIKDGFWEDHAKLRNVLEEKELL